MSAIQKATETTTWALAPRTMDEALRFADMLAKSDLVSRDYKGKAGNVIVAIQMGAELGLSPMQALQNISVINGRPAVWGDAMLAIVSAHPECEDVIESDDGNTATCTVKRRGRSPVTRTFSMEDARQAGLANKEGPWRAYPKRMRQMRARAFACRDAFADALRGLNSAEEVSDIPADAPQHAPREIRAEVVESSAVEHAALPASDDPEDFAIPFGKHAGKPMRELNNQALGWYAKEAKRDDVKAAARRVLDARKAKADAVSGKLDAAKAADRAALTHDEADTNDDWGMGSAGEVEAEVVNG